MKQFSTGYTKGNVGFAILLGAQTPGFEWSEAVLTRCARFTCLRLAVALGVLSTSAFGQQAVPRYKVGDHVEFSANGACLGEQFAISTRGTIIQVNLGSTMNYVMQVDPEPNRSPRTVSRPIYTQDCGFRPSTRPAPAAPATPPPATPTPTPVKPAAQAQVGGSTNVPKYKVGDHVEFSANGACLGDQFAIPTKGTIVQVNLGSTMNYVMQVDPEPNKSPKTISRPIYTQDCGFRLLGGPAPAAPNYTCPLDPPAGPVSKSDGPSQQVFERVIYDDAREAEATHADVQRVGMSFQIFQMGQPYTNQMTDGGLRQDASLHLLIHDGAPPNAVIYPMKVRYTKCIQRPTWKQLWVIEQNRDCFKNRFGDWACPVGTGDTKFLTQLDLPN